MSQRVVVIGAGAVGPKAACRLKRLDPTSDVTLIDRDNLISYAGCGIPFFVSGEVSGLESLYSTSAHVLRDANYFQNVKGVDVRTETEALSIDRIARKITIRSLNDGKEEDIEYDKLMLATGAAPFLPPIPGADLPGVHVVSSLHHAQAIKKAIAHGEVESAVVVGGGAIGLEMAQCLTELWGIETTLVEIMDHLLPGSFGRDMALPIKNHMEEQDVTVLLSEKVTNIIGDKDQGVEAVETTKSKIPCELVIVATGVRPNTKLAQDAGLAIGAFGGILVDDCMRTTDPRIYAGGDCVEIRNLVSGQNVHMPMGVPG